MKAGFWIHLVYRRPLDAADRGLIMWCRTGEDLRDMLHKCGALPSHVKQLRIQKPGEADYKEYDPAVLERLFK